MQQPTIEIIDTSPDKTKSFGVKKVIQMNWDSSGYIWHIVVQFMSGTTDPLHMYLMPEDDQFYSNDCKNLKGRIQFNN